MRARKLFSARVDGDKVETSIGEYGPRPSSGSWGTVSNKTSTVSCQAIMRLNPPFPFNRGRARGPTQRSWQLALRPVSTSHLSILVKKIGK
jgi:hypothetical protein